jgi:hypothetical protein
MNVKDLISQIKIPCNVNEFDKIVNLSLTIHHKHKNKIISQFLEGESFLVDSINLIAIDENNKIIITFPYPSIVSIECALNYSDQVLDYQSKLLKIKNQSIKEERLLAEAIMFYKK